MQYSTLRISALVAILSSPVFAYLDCGGGRAPPKTTVPGCPGYIDPATKAPTLTVSVPMMTTSTHSQVTETVSEGDISGDGYEYDYNYDFTNEGDGESDYYVYSITDNAEPGCTCSGYLCEFALPGCVAIDMDTGASSTITANPGQFTKSFDIDDYRSYIKTAGAGAVYSVDGVYLSMKSDILTETVELSGTSSTKSTPTLTAYSQTTLVQSTISSSTGLVQANSTASTSVRTGTNTTSPAPAQTSLATSDENGASKVGLTSLAALLVSGVVAVALL